MDVLVLGMGNILLSDEGIGVRVIEAFQERYDAPGVEIVDGGTSGMDLVEFLASRKHAIIVDAVRTGAPPGTRVRLEGEQVPAFFRNKISPHQLGLSEVLASLELTGERPGHVILLGVVPDCLDTGLELSGTLLAQRDQMVEALAEELRRLDVRVEERHAH